jgi:hypothetical protein
MSPANDDDAALTNPPLGRISLQTFLLWCPVVPIWLWLTMVLAQSPGIGRLGYVLVPGVLLGITAAFRRLVAQQRNSWAIAAIAAPLIAWFSLLIIASLNALE